MKNQCHLYNYENTNTTVNKDIIGKIHGNYSDVVNHEKYKNTRDDVSGRN